MDFSFVGSVNSYVKSGEMLRKWNLKRSTGNFEADGTKTVSEWLKKQADKRQAMDIYNSSKEDDPLLSDINAKLANGQKLTPDERLYLQKKNPVAYQRLIASEAEQKQYEKELKNCRTKEDVEKVKMTHVASSLSFINSVKNNPNIPEGQKLGLVMQEQQKIKALAKIMDKFVKSGEYAKLPTENEQRIAEKELEEAKRQEQESVIGKENEQESSKPENAELSQESGEKDTDKKTSEQALADDKKLTRYEAENSEEAKKVKRARTSKLYVKSMQETSAAPQNSLKIKAVGTEF